VESADRVTLLFTSDLHGRVGPKDPLTGAVFPGGIARAATLLAEARRRDADAIYVDLGDLVQGTPMSTFFARDRPGQPHPMIRILGQLGCRAMVVGNHDFNFGLPFLESMRQAAGFPFLGANVLGPSGRPYLEPFVSVARRGRRIAILGLTTPQVPRWEEPWNYEGLHFRDAVETAKEWVPRLRERYDAVIVAAHMGWSGVTDGGLEVPVPPENDVSRLVEEVDGMDVVLMAHTHRFDERRARNGTLAVQAAWGGLAIGEISLEWDGRDTRPRVNYELRRAAPYIAADPGVVETAREAMHRADVRIREPLAIADSDFAIPNPRYEDNAILTLFHKAQLDAAGTDLSSAALFRANEGLAAGPIAERDLFRIYPYENDLTIVELSVQDCRDYLEEAALAFTGPSANGGPPPIDARFGLYNQDSLAGCEYVVDPSQPIGSRITSLTFGGRELAGSHRLTLALTSYRAQGGGGYQALRRARVVERTGREIRGILRDYVRRAGRLRPEVLGNWRVVGASNGHSHLSGTSTGA
jgi:2',3'-cyclic-nucleotide 2'-phosphodiesterase/3'-nucleotidase